MSARSSQSVLIGALTGLLLVGATVRGAAEIELSILEPTGVARTAWPITSGVPFAKGALVDPNQSALFNAAGMELPLQTEVLSRWPDGSVRWLLLDTQVDLDANETGAYRLRYGEGVKRSAIPAPIHVANHDDRVDITTGPLQLSLSRQSFRLFDAVWVDHNSDGQFAPDERVTTFHGSGIELTTPDGQSFRADFRRATLTTEQAGPLRACVRIDGAHESPSGKLFRYIVRVHAFRGKAALKAAYTFINDSSDAVMTSVDSIDLTLAVRESEPRPQFAILNGKPSGPATLFQVDDRSYEIDGAAAVGHALGWASLANGRGGLAVGVREFWQNWPKSLAIRNDGQAAKERASRLTVGICPSFETGRYDGKPIEEEAQLYYYLRNGEYSFKVGVSRTHEIWANFFSGRADSADLTNFFKAIDQPLLAQADPRYVSETQAVGRIVPSGSKGLSTRYDRWFTQLFNRHLVDVKQVREYGMLNFGDWYNVNWDSWGNQEYDTARCFFTQYLRSSDRRYFDRASQAARHYLDVDVVHAVNPELHAFPGSAKMRPGHVWLHQVGHTGGYYGRYDGDKYHDEAPLAMKGAYQVGMYNWGHQWIGGVFDYYMLTGDRRALDVARMTADTIAEDCPTHYSDHIRDLGWPLNLEIAAYEAIGEKRYLDAAMRQWKLMKQHLDPEKGFQVLLAFGHCNEQSITKRCRGQNAYMFGLTLSGLARLHRLTNDPEILHGLTAGINQLIRECWSEKHKTFYLSSCVHFRHIDPPALSSASALSSEALAYESGQTGNAEHARILRAAFATLVEAGLQSTLSGELNGQTGYYCMMFHFAPQALWALEE